MQLFKWALILLLLPIQAGFAATPQNPLLVDQDLYLSNNGIHKFNQLSLEQQWSSLNGIQTFERMREIKPEVPCAMLTAYSHSGLTKQFFDEGGADFMVKPIGEDFEERVNAILAKASA